MSAIETVRRNLERVRNGVPRLATNEGQRDPRAVRLALTSEMRTLLDEALAALDSLAPPVPEEVAEAIRDLRVFLAYDCTAAGKFPDGSTDHELELLATITTALHSLTAEVERLRGERDAARQAACIMCQRQDEAPERCDEIECAARTPERT